MRGRRTGSAPRLAPKGSALALALAACAGLPAAPPPTPLEEARRAYCDRVAECDAGRQPIADTLGTSSGCDVAGWRREDEAVRAGLARVDDAAIAACAAALAALPECVVRGVDPFRFPRVGDDVARVCARMVVEARIPCGAGTCAIHEACVRYSTCATRCGTRDCLRCPAALSCDAEGALCTPIPSLAVGEDCDPAADRCRRGAWCDRGSRRCVAEIPRVYLPWGAACTPTTVGGPYCDLGLRCDPSSLTCAWAADVDGDCTASVECGPDRYCHDEPGTGGVCRPTADGARCTTGSPGLFRFERCPAGLECGPDRRCRSVPAAGRACTGSDECRAGERCGAGRCVPPARPWETCSDGRPCTNGYACVRGACTSAIGLAPGDPCPAALCVEAACIAGVCAIPPVGAACEYGDCPRCEGGLCQPVEAIPERGDCSGFDPTLACGAGLACLPAEDGRRVCCPG